MEKEKIKLYYLFLNQKTDSLILFFVFSFYMRIFIAFDISEEAKEELFRIGELIKQNSSEDVKLRLVSKENMHLTLKFIGDVQPNVAEKVKDKLKEAKFESFEAYLEGISLFPNEDYIRVVFVGLKPEDKIIELQKKIEDALKEFKFENDYSFKPHLTIARVKFVKDKKKFVEILNKIKVEKVKFKVDSFKLMQSTLAKEGSVYGEIGVYS